MNRVVTFINQASGTIDTTLLDAFISDFNAVLTTSFLDGWGISAVANRMGGGYHVLLIDEPGPDDPQNALGFHNLGQGFLPYARVFVGFSQRENIPWQAVASHEAFEMLVNPLLNSTTFIDSGNGFSGWIIYDEVCDPCERQSSVGALGSAISNFVLPGWYTPGYTDKVDALGLLPAPLRIASGGYASADYVEYGTGWQTFTGFHVGKNHPRIQKVRK